MINDIRYILLVMLAALLVPISCSRAPVTVPDGTPTTVTVSINTGADTKSTTADDDSESIVNDLQVLIFDLGGAIDGYGHRTSSNDISVATHTGIHEVWAVTNFSDLSGVTTKAALMATVASLDDERVGDLVHVGGKEVNLSMLETVHLSLEHLVSRVVVKKITNRLYPEALSSQTFKLLDIYLTNVVGDINLGVSSGTTEWLNKMGLQNDAEFFLHDAIPSGSQTLPLNSSYTTEHRFYMLPNLQEEDSRSASWDARHTRLIVKASIGEEIYFYPITLPAGENNISYEVDELVIARIGVKNEETEIPFTAITFDVSVGAFVSQSETASFTCEPLSVVFAEPEVNPFELLSDGLSLAGYGAGIIFIGDGTVSPWDGIDSVFNGKMLDDDTILLIGDLVSGYDSIAGTIIGGMTNGTIFLFNPAVAPLETLADMLSGKILSHLKVVFANGTVADLTAVAAALQGIIAERLTLQIGDCTVTGWAALAEAISGGAINLITVIFNEGAVVDWAELAAVLSGDFASRIALIFSGGVADSEAIAQLIQFLGDRMVLVINGEIVSFEEISGELSFLTEHFTMLFGISLSEWEEYMTVVDFPLS